MGSCIAEGIGTFALVPIGTRAIVVDDVTGGGVGHLGEDARPIPFG